MAERSKRSKINSSEKGVRKGNASSERKKSAARTVTRSRLSRSTSPALENDRVGHPLAESSPPATLVAFVTDRGANTNMVDLKISHLGVTTLEPSVVTQVSNKPAAPAADATQATNSAVPRPGRRYSMRRASTILGMMGPASGAAQRPGRRSSLRRASAMLGMMGPPRGKSKDIVPEPSPKLQRALNAKAMIAKRAGKGQQAGHSQIYMEPIPYVPHIKHPDLLVQHGEHPVPLRTLLNMSPFAYKTKDAQLMDRLAKVRPRAHDS